MNSVHIQQIPEEERKSPQGVYHLFQKNISLALGGKKDIGLWGSGHPFDLASVRVSAGCKNWPVHRHSAQWELYYFLEGEGRYFDGKNWIEIRAGQIADMPQADRTSYPVTGRTFVKPERKFIDGVFAAYYDGHE